MATTQLVRANRSRRLAKREHAPLRSHYRHFSDLLHDESAVEDLWRAIFMALLDKCSALQDQMMSREELIRAYYSDIDKLKACTIELREFVQLIATETIVTEVHRSADMESRKIGQNHANAEKQNLIAEFANKICPSVQVEAPEPEAWIIANYRQLSDAIAQDLEDRVRAVVNTVFQVMLGGVEYNLFGVVQWTAGSRWANGTVAEYAYIEHLIKTTANRSGQSVTSEIERWKNTTFHTVVNAKTTPLENPQLKLPDHVERIAEAIPEFLRDAAGVFKYVSGDLVAGCVIRELAGKDVHEDVIPEREVKREVKYDPALTFGKRIVIVGWSE